MEERRIYLRCLLLFIYTMMIIRAYCTTHWVVTDDGKIQAQMDSIYQLRKPYDFLALKQQEQRAVQVETLKKELIAQKAHIDKNEDKDTQLEERIYRTDSDCVLAGKPLTEFDLYASTNVDLEKEGIKDNLTATPEEDLLLVGNGNNSAVWGHRVAKSLQKNNTEWLLYSLGAQYWRVKADPRKAVECIRRSLHFVSRKYRHIPLVHLGNIFHRSHLLEEAAVVLHMAIDHSEQCIGAHITLGNIYATLGVYNVSSLCLENALYMLPFKLELRKRKYAVLCHAKLESALEKQHQSLQRTLSELREYQKTHEELLNLQQKLLLEQATPEMKLESRLEYEEQKIRESSDGRGQDCFQYQQDGHTFLSCNMRRDQLEQRGNPPSELILDLQNLLHAMESEALRLRQLVLKRKQTYVSSSLLITSPVPHVSPRQKKRKEKKFREINEGTDGLLIKNILAEESCANSNPAYIEDPPVIYFTPEKKGFQINVILENDDSACVLDSDIPCDAPVCSSLLNTEEINNIWEIIENIQLPLNLPDDSVRDFLSQYDVDDIGTKISLSLQNGIGPKWILYNLAGLYWRSLGNFPHSSICFLQALSAAPEEWKDVPLVNVAALMYSAGYFDEALHITLQALLVNYNEATTNFLIACTYFMKSNYTLAFLSFRKVVIEDPEFPHAKEYLKHLYCILKNKNLLLDDVCDEETNCDEHYSEVLPFEDNTEVEKTDVKEVVLEDIQIEDESQKDSVEHEKNSKKPLHVHIGLGTEDSEQDPLVIEDDPLPDVLLRVRERVASPPPPPHVCEGSVTKLSNIKDFTSTWLSVTAKNIDISQYLVPPPVEGTPLEEPKCKGDLPASMHTLDHLAGIRHRTKLPHFPEMGLREALQMLSDRIPLPVDIMATRISRSLEKNETSWVVATAAALYWRVVGSGHRAVDCLRQALHYAPRHMKDIPLVSLANILHRANLHNNALVVANMALEISPKFVVIHFTMANIYAAKGDMEKAIAFYQSTLSLQSTFEPARDRLLAIQCSSVNEEPLT